MRGRVSILLFSCLLLVLNGLSQETKFSNDRNTRNTSLATAPADRSAELTRTLTSGGGAYGPRLGTLTSMYLNDDFIPGVIVLFDGTEMSDLPLRYNVYYQQMQFIDGDDTLAVADPAQIKLISYDERDFIFYQFERNSILDTGIFEVIMDGECKLMVRHQVDYHLEADDPAKEGFVKSSQLYVSKKGKPAVKMNPNKKSVCNAFHDKQEEVKEFIRSNKLKMNRYQDVILVVEFYNSIK